MFTAKISIGTAAAASMKKVMYKKLARRSRRRRRCLTGGFLVVVVIIGFITILVQTSFARSAINNNGNGDDDKTEQKEVFSTNKSGESNKNTNETTWWTRPKPTVENTRVAPLDGESKTLALTSSLTQKISGNSRIKEMPTVEAEPKSDPGDDKIPIKSSTEPQKQDESDPKSVLKTINPKQKCTERKGLIIANMLGRIGNNLFEIGFANRLATQLCWDIVYRSAWASTFPSDAAQHCFPNAIISNQINKTYWTTKYKWDGRIWDALTVPDDSNVSDAVAIASDMMAEEILPNISNETFQYQHLFQDFTGDNVDRFIQELHQPNSTTNIIFTNAFFIHFDWMREWIDEFREWFWIRPSCCQTKPPPDAVVIHIRNFEHGDLGLKNLPWNVTVFQHIISQYKYGGRPVWVVCEPRSVNDVLVKSLELELNASVHVGSDPYDAFCVLTQARVLILSTGSTFSQSAALLAPKDAEIHYPTYTVNYPRVTLKVPWWKVHLVSEDRKRVEIFDVNQTLLNVRFAD